MRPNETSGLQGNRGVVHHRVLPYVEFLALILCWTCQDHTCKGISLLRYGSVTVALTGSSECLNDLQRQYLNIFNLS